MKKKEKKLSRYLDQHEYPALFNRFPVFIRLVYFANSILTLRNWYVYRALRQLEKKYSNGFSFLDAGCGMGEFSLGVAKRHPNAHVIGVDFAEPNSILANRVADSMNLRNIEFQQGDLTKWSSNINFDLALCNSTLQFIKDDVSALANLCAILKQKGTLLLYIPVRYRRYFPWSESLEIKYLSDFFYRYHDDFLMHRYDVNEIIKKVQQNGFIIKNTLNAYGISGAVAFELYSLILVAVKRLPFVLSIPAVIVYILLLFPIQILLMIIDYLQIHPEGNGLLIEAEKL